jgi:hypothetical protein
MALWEVSIALLHGKEAEERLANGWEPFAVYTNAGNWPVLALRRQAESGAEDESG